MSTNQLDDASQHPVQTQETKVSFLSKIKKYVSMSLSFASDRVFSLKKSFGVARTIAIEMKSYLITKLFWGRGSLYRYIALVAIFIPIAVSIGIIYATRTSPTVERKIVLTNTFINEAANQTDNVGVQGKLVETDVLVAGNNLFTQYQVKQGDTLASIAKQYNVSTDTLEWANNLSSDTVTPGQTIIINPAQGFIYTTVNGDTIDSVSQNFSVTQSQIQAWNVLIDFSKPLSSGQKIFIPGSQKSQTTEIPTTFYTGITDGASVGCPSNIPWCYLQGDPRWGNMILGGFGAQNAYSGLNVRNIGCFITDVAMVSSYYYPDKHITPATIAYNPGYFVGGGLYNLSGLGLFNVTPLGNVWGGGVEWNAIDSQLAAGHPVIVYVPYLRGHYVLLYQKVGNTYIMADPARGADLNFSKYYYKGSVSQAFLYTPIH